MKRFTPCERRVLDMRASGIPPKEIAFELKRSLKAFEFHWANIKRKVGQDDVVAVCRWAWLRGMGQKFSQGNTVNNSA